jgi:spectrin alpha
LFCLVSILIPDSSPRYANLLDLGSQRREKLQESNKAYQLVREAAELASWITEKENLMVAEDVGDDLEQVEEMQKKFDDFQKVRDISLVTCP